MPDPDANYITRGLLTIRIKQGNSVSLLVNQELTNFNEDILIEKNFASVSLDAGTRKMQYKWKMLYEVPGKTPQEKTFVTYTRYAIVILEKIF